MINYKDTAAMMKLITASCELRDVYLAAQKTLVGAWVGRYYRSDTTTPVHLENYIGAFLWYMLPRISTSTPRPIVSSTTSDENQATAEVMEDGIYWSAKRQRYSKDVARRAIRDMLLGWGVTMTTFDRGKRLPVVSWVAAGDHFVDGEGYGYDQRRFEGRTFDRDLDELLADPLYDRSVLRGMSGNSTQEQRPDSPFPAPPVDDLSRKVTLHEVWIKGAGRIVTYAETGNGGGILVRDAEYRGPADGPYTVWGVFEVPGQIYPLSPLVASYEQITDVNDHVRVMRRSAARRKSFGVFRRANTEDGTTLKSARDGDLLGLVEPDGFKVGEVGGITQQQIDIIGILRDRADRNLSMNDVQRGSANSETATANQLAQQSTDLKTAWIQLQAVEAVITDYRKIGWWLWNEPSVSFRYSTVDPKTGVPKSGEFFGGEPESFPPEIMSSQDGLFAGQVGTDWDDYDLDVPSESMTATTDPIRQRRAVDELNFVFNQLLPVFGDRVNLERAIDRYGDAMNQRNLSQILLKESGPPMGMPGGSPQPQAGGVVPGSLQQQAVAGV